MALTIAVVVAVGFGPTANARLFHPASPRPLILYVHAALLVLGAVLLWRLGPFPAWPAASEAPPSPATR